MLWVPVLGSAHPVLSGPENIPEGVCIKQVQLYLIKQYSAKFKNERMLCHVVQEIQTMLNFSA